MKIYLHPLAHVQFIKKLRVIQRQNRKLLHLAEHSYH